MTAVLERLREQLDALQQEIEAVAVVAAEVDTVKADCAVAMEAAHADAIWQWRTAGGHMSAVLERLREQLDALQQEIEAVAVVAAEVDTVKADCAVAIKAAHADAIRQCETGREEAIQHGKNMERERILLLISLVSESVKEGGSNAVALATLRRMVVGGDRP